VFALVWLAVAVVGIAAITMALRIYRDEDWETGDWWAFTSYFALRGLVFMFLFPTIRSPHTRHAERVNAVVVMIWGAVLVALGVGLVWYESAR